MDSVSRQARAYVLTVIAAGALLLAWQLALATPRLTVWLLAVGVVAVVGQVFEVEGATGQSGYNAALAAYGFALLAFGLPSALAVMLMACLLDWAWRRYSWYTQTFNIAAMALALGAASLVHGLVVAFLGGSLAVSVAAAVIASVTFVLTNHLQVGWAIQLVQQQTVRESGAFGRLPLVVDGTIFTLGTLTGALWLTTPFVIILAALPLYSIYLSLRVPSLERRVNTDSKTGLYNLAHFNAELAKELERAERFSRPLTVVLGDLDLLRNINNTFGHLAGDVALVGVAQILKESVREYDVVARFGGEEFAILMPETTPADAAAHIDEIREQIAAARFDVTTSVDAIGVTMSFGVAGLDAPGRTTAELMHQADLAVYRAKLEGRNRVCISQTWDDTFVPFVSTSLDALQIPLQTPIAAEESAGHTHAALEAPGQQVGVQAVPAQVEAAGTSVEPREVHVARVRPALSGGAVSARILVTVLVAVAFLAVALYWANFTPGAPRFLGVGQGLLTFALMALGAEILSIEIYARDTSVSTSAAVLVAGALVFGPVGALVLSVIVASAAFLHNHSSPSKLIFNASVHTLAGLGVAGAVLLVGPASSSYADWRWAAVSVVAGLLYFALTTAAVSWALSWNGGPSSAEIWNERFRWLAPYYVGLGLAAYGLAFATSVAGPLGAMVVVAPLVMLRLSQEQYVDRTRSVVSELRAANEDLRANSARVSQLSEELFMVLASAVDARDPDVVNHSQNVSRYAVLIAERLGISGRQLDLIRKASLLHDLGKLGVPEPILFKPARLSIREYMTVKEHSRLGAEILLDSDSLRDVGPIVLHHHERYDGTGYPDGLARDGIPLEARIIALADAVEAMASDRPYRAGMHARDIVTEIRAHAGTQFDPDVVAAFCAVVERDGMSTIVNGSRHEASDLAEVSA